MLSLCRAVIEDYVSLFCAADDTNPLVNLPKLSKLFTCNFLTVLTYIYEPEGTVLAFSFEASFFMAFLLYHFFVGSKNLQQIPLKLLKIVTRWLKDDSCLCLTSLSSPLSSRMNRWTSPNKSNTQTPTPGLVRWCVKAPLLAETSCRELNNKYDASATQQEKGDSVESCSADDTWHDLHLAVLETMLSLRSLEDAAQLELLTITDMNRIVNELLQLSSSLDRNERVLLGLDRFAQFLQISLTTGAFRCSLIDLRRICQALPKTE